MYRFNFDSTTGISDNLDTISLLDKLCLKDCNSNMDQVLEQLGVLHIIKEIAKDPNGWLMKNGLQSEFPIWVTLADKISPDLPRGHVGVLFFKYTVIDWIYAHKYCFTSKNGDAFTDNDLYEYVNKWGFTTDHLDEVLMQKAENFDEGWFGGPECVDEPSPSNLVQPVLFNLDSRYFDRVKPGVPMSISVNMRKVVALSQNIQEQLGAVEIAAVTCKNGDVNKKRARSLIRHKLKNGSLKITEQQKTLKESLFVSVDQIDVNTPVNLHIFGQSIAVPAHKCALIDTRGFNRRSKKFREFNISDIDATEIIKQSTLAFILFMNQINFVPLSGQHGIFLSSINEESMLYEVSYMVDDKICVNGRAAGDIEEGTEASHLWHEFGNNDWMLLPDRNYFIVTIGKSMICYVEG